MPPKHAKNHDRHTPRLHRVGKWMPSTHDEHHKWLGGVIAHVDGKTSHELHPVLKEFQHLIETNTRVYMLVSAMFKEIPRNRPYSTDPTGCPQIRDYHHMLRVLNYLLTTAPSWNDFSQRVGLVGLPINAVLDWSMGTASGFAAFLQSPASAGVLDDSPFGWFGETGKQTLELVANVPMGTNYSFEEMFVCEPSKKYHGYQSWDDFFTRVFHPGIRPVVSPEDDNVIANACESQPYKVARDVKERDLFWIKTQPYSIKDMLAHDELMPQFVGGTIYQAFLSALSYHRWHAPVSGKIVKAYVVDGTYYSEPLYDGLGDPSSTGNIDVAGEVTSQEYITATATRAVVFIEADNPAIGLMAFLGVGMCEVSTCDLTVRQGQHVSKGEQIGMFHYGGSTHCLLFRRGVDVREFPSADTEHNIPVRGKVAVVSS